MRNVSCSPIRFSTSWKLFVYLVLSGFGIYLYIGLSSYYRKFALSAEYFHNIQADRLRVSQLTADWKKTLSRNTDEEVGFWSYLVNYEYLCENNLTGGWLSSVEDSVTSSLCPCVSPLLVGRRVPDVKELHSLSWSNVSRQVGELDPGGHWRPSLCRPRLRLAVIIPYRDREKDLRAQLITLYPILKRQLVQFRTFVIEQSWPALYNKGAMLDIGFLEAAKRWRFDCVLFQDVDLIMEDDRNIIHCLPDQPLHLGAYLNEQKYKLKYATIVGGALSFTRRMFEDLNGYTTLYFGWGGEDDNMKGRINRRGLNLARPNLVARYTHIKNLKRGDPSNPVDKHSRTVLAQKKYNIDATTDGLNSVKYNVTESVDGSLFTWINVVLDVRPLYTYHNRPTFSYSVELLTECEREILQDTDVSFSTCKYLCDMKAGCAGFLIQRSPDIRCVLKSKCLSGEGKLQLAGKGTFYKKSYPIKELEEIGIREKLPYDYPYPSN